MMVLGVLALGAWAADFTLREELERTWTHEFVTFPLTAAQAKKAQAGAPLLGSDDKPVVYQVLPGENNTSRIGFQTDLGPLEVRDFSLADKGKAEKTTDLKITDGPDVLMLQNGLTGIALRKTAVPGNGPIAGVLLNSGKWVAGSRLLGDTPVTDYSLQVTKRGPVLLEAVCKITFGDKGTWLSRYRVFANEPVVLVDERCALDAPVSFSLVLNNNFNAETLFFRNGDAPYGKNNTLDIAAAKDGKLFDWEPWLRWHASNARGSTFSVYNAADKDLLSVAAREAGAWVDPAIAWKLQASSTLPLVKDANGVHVDMPIMHGQRKWMFTALDKESSLTYLTDQKKDTNSPPPYQYLIKYGHFPLDMIKDYVTRWPHKLDHPRLLMTTKDVERFKAGIKDYEPYKKSADYFKRFPDQLYAHRMDEAVPAMLATDDPDFAAVLVNYCHKLLKEEVDYLIDQNGLPFGAAPHHQQGLGTAIGLADIIYSHPNVTPEGRERLRALIAFLGYTTSRPEYWSTARGFAANPNMTTSVYGYQASIAALIADHPCAKAWCQEGMDAVKDQLDNWSDDNGGWLEAPHYAMVSYDQILGLLVMGYNAGFNDWLYSDPKTKTVIRWFAQIDTPPDSRIGGFRHRPALGNTYMCEPNGDFGLLAYLFKDKDPQFSAEMQWQYLQNNKYGSAGVGGFFPAFAGYRNLLTDPNLPAKAPVYASAVFPKTGVVLRDGYPSNRETYLHMIQGDHHAHYDMDSGSIVLFGKGRILSDEFGYYGCTPEEDHSMVSSPMAGYGVMYLREHSFSPRFDYVAGTKQAYARQIAFVKGLTNDDPAYFVLNDALNVSGPMTWRIWLTAQDVQVRPQGALVVGKEDVDMDVVFITPQGIPLRTESKTRTSGSGMHPNWNWNQYPSTQTGLIADLPRTAGTLVVLYPRLKTARPVQCTPLAGGKGVKVVHELGTDYVFLSNEPFTYDEGDIHFEGMAGMIQLRGRDVVVKMGSGGKISARGKTDVSTAPLPKVSKNLFPNNGDFENGSLAPMTPISEGPCQLSLFKGNPWAGDVTHKGNYCAAFTLTEKGGTAYGTNFAIPVDNTRVYRISIDVYTEAAIQGQFGGYAVNGTDQNAKDAQGRVWEWSFWTKGPTNGWQTLSTTIGPAGSGAALTWPPALNSTHITPRIGGEAGTFYVDNITVEPQ
jgi:hypothetical protein